MVSGFGLGTPGSPGGKTTSGTDRVKVRLAVLALLIITAFVALYSRLWFLQVLASEDYQQLARENRVRLVYSEPPRGRILDKNGVLLVDNRQSLALTVDRQVIDEPTEQKQTLRRIAKLLIRYEEPKKGEPDPSKMSRKEFKRYKRSRIRELREGLTDTSVSPYKPVAVAYDVPLEAVLHIRENREDFRGVFDDDLPVRRYPAGDHAAHILGYVNEITETQLKSDLFKNRRPRYEAGDIVGQAGVELIYDRFLRGRPEISRVVVNSSGDVIASDKIQEEVTGKDLVLNLDWRIQKITEKALANGIAAARGAGYEAPNGAVVVLDPTTGGVVSMASFPYFKSSDFVDGISEKELDDLGGRTRQDGSDDALVNRAIQSQVPPGSTFKVVTAGAGVANGVLSPTEYISCPGVYEYREEPFNNWTSADYGSMALPRSLEVSCDSYYYEVGRRLEERFGPPESAGGDGTERFQKYMRRAGFGHETGVDLPYETSGRVPDKEWCEYWERIDAGCFEGWLPGFTINMSIGQGDLTVSPTQMAVTYAAIVNGGNVLEPLVASFAGRPDPETGDEDVLKEFTSTTAAELPLDDFTLAQMREGLELVVASGEGTANTAFAGFPLDQFPIAGKTGTAQIGSLESGKNFAWFMSYAPADDPEYVVAVYIERAGHGGESAAPVARQIYEGIFELDKDTSVQLGVDASG
jgi:penicillin-binding protein 2